MVQDKTPLFVETDEAGNVTNFAEFVSGTDVVSQELGGTGATSVSGAVIGLGSSILIDELASGVSGAAQQATGLIFNPTTGKITPEPGVTDVNITGKTLTVSSISCRLINSGLFTLTDVGVSATDLSAETFKGASVSATAISGLTFNGMPSPPPFGYIQLDADDVLSSDEKKLGYSNTPTSIVSNTADITWDDTNKYFVCVTAGTYEVLGVVILKGGSSLVNLSVQRNGSDILVGQPRVHNSIDPLEHTIRAIFTMTAGQNTGITYEATAAATVQAIIGSTATVKRLK